MKILSFPLVYHDISFSIIEDGKIVFYRMKERFSRIKHDSDISNLIDILYEKILIFDQIVFVNPFLGEKLSISVDKIINKIKSIKNNKFTIVEKKHHIYHAYSGFYNSNFDEALCFSLDGCGALIENKNIEIEYLYLPEIETLVTIKNKKRILYQ